MIHASNNPVQGLSAVANVSEQLPAAAGQQTDLEIVLAAWHTATDRLQKTHELLRDEVHRLSDELEIKNRELARKIGWPTWGKWRRTLPTKCGMDWRQSPCIWDCFAAEW